MQILHKLKLPFPLAIFRRHVVSATFNFFVQLDTKHDGVTLYSHIFFANRRSQTLFDLRRDLNEQFAGKWYFKFGSEKFITITDKPVNSDKDITEFLFPAYSENYSDYIGATGLVRKNPFQRSFKT